MSLTQNNQWLNSALSAPSVPSGQVSLSIEMPNLPGQITLPSTPSSDTRSPFSPTSYEAGLSQMEQGSGSLVRKWPYWKQISEEEFKARNERRLEHNRISAKLARERKKNFVNSLEEQVNQLQEKKLQLETMVAMLSQENDRLRTEVSAGTMLVSTPVTSQILDQAFPEHFQ